MAGPFPLQRGIWIEGVQSIVHQVLAPYIPHVIHVRFLIGPKFMAPAGQCGRGEVKAVPRNKKEILQAKVTIMLCQLKSCQRCTGDLVLDGDEWRCWQCGHYYYPRLSLPELPLEVADPSPSGDPADLPGATPRRRRRSRWAVSDINALLVAKDRSEQRWWTRNEQLIKYLDEGKSAREIAALVGRSERQIRVVREQLNDLRAVTEAERCAV